MRLTTTYQEEIKNLEQLEKMSPLQTMIYETMIEIRNTDEYIVRAATSVKEVAQEVGDKIVYQGGNIRLNGLGELQRRAQDFDQAIVKRETLQEQLLRLQWLEAKEQDSDF